MKTSLLPALLFALALPLAAWIFGHYYEGAREVVSRGPSTISVKGYAERPISSDMASWTASYRTQALRLQDAYAQLETDRQKIIRYLDSQDVDASAIQFQPVMTETQYELGPNGYITNQIVGYALTQSFSLQEKTVEKIEALAIQSSELIRQGVNFQSQPPQYLISNIEELKIEMLGLAARNALERACQLAENTNASVGRLVSASQGVFQITAPNSNEVADYGIFDTYAREKSIKAVVSMTFTVE